MRKFFCDNAACPRRIFTEPIPTVMAAWARRTQRLAKQLYELELRLGEATGAKMSQDLFCSVSRNTLLRLPMKQPLPAYATPITLGVDAFALHKRQTYGTILVDLDQHRPIALLPGRDAAGLSQWLMQHPGIQVLSHDRSPVYKSGMNQGAPDTLQVADRFHLIHNLAEALEQVFRSQMSELRRITSPHAEAGEIENGAANGSEVKPSNAVEPLSTLLKTLSVPLETHYQRRHAV